MLGNGTQFTRLRRLCPAGRSLIRPRGRPVFQSTVTYVGALATHRYQLKHLLIISGLDALAKSIPPLKGAKKIAALDIIWTRVCLDNGWAS